MYAYSYGPASSVDVIWGRQVAKALRLPWKRVDLGADYLAKYTRVWADWFGSSLHFHGMYQMPFLKVVRKENMPIITGYIGDALAGNQTAGMMLKWINT